MGLRGPKAASIAALEARGSPLAARRKREVRRLLEALREGTDAHKVFRYDDPGADGHSPWRRIVAAWDERGEQVLADYIAEFPGCRPWAHWVLNAPEEPREGESEVEYWQRHGELSDAEYAAALAAEQGGDDAK